MLQYINVPIGCAVFRMAIGTLTYWHIVALTHYLFYFTQTSFRREINVFRIALISHLTTTGCFRSQRTGHITFHITRGTGTSSYIYRLHTFCLYIPTTTGSIRSVLTNTCQNYISGRAGISRYISSVQILDRYITRTTGISREICTRYLFQNHITRTISGSRKIITRNNASCYITATASLNSNFPTRFQSIFIIMSPELEAFKLFTAGAETLTSFLCFPFIEKLFLGDLKPTLSTPPSTRTSI